MSRSQKIRVKEHEEHPNPRENFERVMTALFKVPKAKAASQKSAGKAASGKPKRDKD